MKIPVFYTPKMLANADSQSPSAHKPAQVLQSWQEQGFAIEVLEPAPVRRADFVRAHDPDFVDDVMQLRQYNGFGNRLPAVAASLPYTSGAMLAAARMALANAQVAVAPVSGFHHASYDIGGGYCTFNGLLVAALALKAERLVQRVGIFDCDHHYGNGTEDIIRKLNLDWVLHYTAGRTYQGCRNGEKAAAFLADIPVQLERMKHCDVLLYQAGADPHEDDPLGGWLSTAQLQERDRLVFATAKRLKLPVAWNLAGGYQEPLRRVLDIHDNTMRECVAVFAGGP